MMSNSLKQLMMMIVFCLMIISDGTCQTFQYSRGWVNGKRNLPMKYISPTVDRSIIHCCNLKVLHQANKIHEVECVLPSVDIYCDPAAVSFVFPKNLMRYGGDVLTNYLRSGSSDISAGLPMSVGDDNSINNE